MQFSKPFIFVIFLMFLFAAGIGLFFSWSGLIFTFTGIVFTFLLLLLLFIQLLSKTSFKSPITMIFLLWSAQITGLGFNLLKPTPAAMLEDPHSPEQQIEYMYNTQIIDHQLVKNYIFSNHYEASIKRDSLRAAKVVELHEEKEINSARSLYQAASILRNTEEAQLLKRGYEIASDAEKKDPSIPNITRLKEVLHDKWMIAEGKQPEYDTQRGPIPGNF